MRKVICLLFVIFLVSPEIQAKGNSDARAAELLYLVTPQTAPGYIAVIFIDENTVAILGKTARDDDSLFPCSDMKCAPASDQFSRPYMSCETKEWCSEVRRVSLKLGHVRCQGDRHRECLEIGISSGVGDYLWLVPVQMSNEEFVRRWGGLPFGGALVPKSAEEWKSAVDNVILVRRLDRIAEENQKRSREAMRVEKVSGCLRELKAGDAVSKVYSCGAPDHTNSDLYTDQLVFFEGTIVYIDRATNRVENVQWSH